MSDLFCSLFPNMDKTAFHESCISCIVSSQGCAVSSDPRVSLLGPCFQSAEKLQRCTLGPSPNRAALKPARLEAYSNRAPWQWVSGFKLKDRGTPICPAAGSVSRDALASGNWENKNASSIPAWPRQVSAAGIPAGWDLHATSAGVRYFLVGLPLTNMAAGWLRLGLLRLLRKPRQGKQVYSPPPKLPRSSEVKPGYAAKGERQ